MDHLTIAVLHSNSQTPERVNFSRLLQGADRVTDPGFTKGEGCLRAEAASDPQVEQRNLLRLLACPDKLYSRC